MPRVAAIDCGTNSIRLLVADAAPGPDGRPRLTDVHREMRIVRLGQGVDATGVLNPGAIERTRVALADYVAILREAGAERVRMVATSATRDAANRDDFFGMVRATLGTDAEVISGDTEARLSFTGAVGDLPAEDGPFVVVDVGGGSTEVVVGSRTEGGVEVHAARSVDIGCVRITERCLRSDPPTEDERAAGRELAQVADELLTRTRDQRMEFGAMHPGRVDVIGGGALIVTVLAEELAKRAGITELVVSEHDILDGIALSLV